MNYHWLRENGRLVSIVAATLIALACGTNVCTEKQHQMPWLTCLCSTRTRHGRPNSPND